jgi:NADH-quinone oxidoreductase subunit N
MGANSAISAYYYLKLIVYMFLKEPVDVREGNTVYYNASKPLLTVLGISVAVTVGSVFFTEPLIESITTMVQATKLIP